MARPTSWAFLLLHSILTTLISSVIAFEVPIIDKDYAREVCSGMWGGPEAYINVTFDSTSRGDLAMLIYEWTDVKYVGKEAKHAADSYEILPKIYVCTSKVEAAGYCTREQLGHFIVNLPEGKSREQTTIWDARVQFPVDNATHSVSALAANDGLWIDPSTKLPSPPHDPHGYTSPWRREVNTIRRWPPTPSADLLVYKDAIHYPVPKTGFYCVAAIPLTVKNGGTETADDESSLHGPYSGRVLFQNTFKGQLPATDYPKVTFYFIMFIAYAAFACVWAWFSYRHLQDLLPIQYYLSGLVALLVIEMLANWVYYRYLNAHGKGTASTVFLIVVAILDAGRNSMSFFMLLVVSLGLSVVRESLGKLMIRCQALATAHFIFGILYAVGIVELELESTSAFTLLLFIIPLAFTLSGFLMWIMYALNATIVHLRTRKQHYKLKMFERLYYILLFCVLAIAAFFVVSSMSFSGRLAEDYAAKTWRYRWWLLDGWLALLYLAAFTLISILWRPNEIAQDEEDAEDYDMEALQERTRIRQEDDDDAATLVGGRRPGHGEPADDGVVFEIGDEDEDDEGKPRKPTRLSGENHRGTDLEREGLMR